MNGWTPFPLVKVLFIFRLYHCSVEEAKSKVKEKFKL